ncbi:MAG: DUF4162 domain-containing protein, partial [Janthinobacterium lividum]
SELHTEADRTAQTVRVDTDRTEDAASLLRTLGLTDVRLGEAHVTALLGEVAIEKVVPELVNDGVPVLGFAVLRPSLEDVFVSLTGEGFDVSG